mmetsp:Transcript_3789/g.11101  ORF Transcript_3789/g.11101 Transcript_3789/m.11101 type:complete len:201 (+) Transcript_3789:62-664(+)
MRTSRRACSSFVLAGHPLLRRVATPVRGVAARADLPRLDAALRSALGEHYGVAAPQLGTSARVFLLRAHADDEPWIAINPSIQRRSREMVAGWETCLSVPGYAASVERPAAVDVRYERLDGTAVERRLRGFEARVFQHELDHLDGILFTDKADPRSLVHESYLLGDGPDSEAVCASLRQLAPEYEEEEYEESAGEGPRGP